MKKCFMGFFNAALTVLCIVLPAYAGDETGWGIAPIAAPYYTPDTKWGIGAYIVTYYKPPEGASFTKPDEYTFYAAYTQLEQITFGFLPEVYLGSGLFKISCKSEYNKYPSSFWGIGPETPDASKEDYTPVEYWGDLAFLVNLGPLYIGPLYHIRSCSITETDERGIIDSGAVTGGDGSFESGAGISFQIDTRDSLFYPKSGFFITGKSSYQSGKLGSDETFGRHEYGARFFLGITGDHVLAFHFKAKIAHGDVPLRSLCGIGGNEIMRGYLDNRYLDMTALAVQAEYRFPVAWRIGWVVNAAAGEVQPSLKDYNTGDLHYAAGTGLRLIIDKSEHISGRIDLGFDEEGTLSVYVLAKEAF